LFKTKRLKLSFQNSVLDDLIRNVFKEVNKQSSSIDTTYKIFSLRCLADLVQFGSTQSKEVYFEQFWSTILENYFSIELENLTLKENKRQENLIQQIKNKHKVGDVEMKETQEDNVVEMVENNEVTAKKRAIKENEANNREEDEEEEQKNEAIKLVILENIGKCWSYNSDMQGSF